ncbi:PREDICTED: transmembrane channel-like protein 6, partial [Tauraco erythrolophus]|uniref:transmembrane channel-like protein 6 n=1 Tax=Tauraco erythrolophus TaxID=121530 RepID=UPI0005233B41
GYSLLYYGYYSNVTLNDPCASSPHGSTCPLAAPLLPYNMPLAYLISIGIFFLVTCVLLVYSVSHSFRESVGSSAGDLAVKELLAERRSRSRSLRLCRRLARSAVLLMAWTLSLSTVLGCVLAVYHFSEHMHAGSAMSILGLLCYQWLSGRVVCSTEECWETCVGQDLYRFMVMDFIFTLLDTLFGELVWRLILEKRLKRKQRPEFDIARNVLELIYGQTLTW